MHRVGLVLTLTLAGFSVARDAPQTAKNSLETAPIPNDADELTVYLSLSKTTFVVGQPIPVKVEVENQGHKPLLVRNEIPVATVIGGTAARLEFELTDSRGISSLR